MLAQALWALLEASSVEHGIERFITPAPLSSALPAATFHPNQLFLAARAWSQMPALGASISKRPGNAVLRFSRSTWGVHGPRQVLAQALWALLEASSFKHAS